VKREYVKNEHGERSFHEREQVFQVSDYDLAATLNSGQVFRWHWEGRGWTGVVGERWVCLEQVQEGIMAVTAAPVADWTWLESYLQLGIDLAGVLGTFPDDEPMRAATACCRGLRLLRQKPWECMASFILSSTKQIVQIRQIAAALCERYGAKIPALSGSGAAFTFPGPERLAAATERDLRACKMGFRAPYLLETAKRVAGGAIDLEALGEWPVEQARAALMDLPGVGRKVADCVLLFAYGFQSAFPLDVWVLRALRELYFRRGRVSAKRLEKFAAGHFGPYAGYAQQYLFHYMRTGGH
jgi:N-glycosylase/DNA lyase